WSSDVCASDLPKLKIKEPGARFSMNNHLEGCSEFCHVSDSGDLAKTLHSRGELKNHPNSLVVEFLFLRIVFLILLAFQTNNLLTELLDFEEKQWLPTCFRQVVKQSSYPRCFQEFFLLFL